MTRWRGSWTLVVGLALAACAPGGMRTQLHDYSTSAYDEFRYDAARQPVPVRIVGNPFAPLPDADLAAALIEAMKGANWGSPARFTGDPAPNRYHIVLAFGVAPGTPHYRLCAEDFAVGASHAGPVRLSAMLCRNATPLREVVGAVDRADSARDPRLRRLVRQEILELTSPQRDPIEPEHPCIPGC